MAKFAAKTALWTLILLLALPPVTAQASKRSACVSQIYSDFSEAQRRLQHDLRDLVAASQAHLEEVAALNTDFQLKRIRQNEQRFRSLSRRHPERVEAIQGVIGLINLTGNWSKKDEDALLDNDAGYWVLQKSLDMAQKRTLNHRDWPALQKFFGTSMTSDPAFRKAQQRLEAAVARADDGLAGCR